MFNTIFSSYYYVKKLNCNLSDIKNNILQVQKEDKKGVVVSNKGGWQSKSFKKIHKPLQPLFNSLLEITQEIKNKLKLKIN